MFFTVQMLTPQLNNEPISFVFVTTNNPTEFLSGVRANSDSSFLILRRPLVSRRTGYAIEHVHFQRMVLNLTERDYGSTILQFHRGVIFPWDLTFADGPWRRPLNLSLPNLTLLDLGMHDAVLWLIPLLTAIPSLTDFRRLIIRNCDDHNRLALAFPFEQLDYQWARLPAMKLLIGWGMDHIISDMFVNVFRSNLPMLESAGRIEVLYSAGPRCK
jgi:hypothetical protein